MSIDSLTKLEQKWWKSGFSSKYCFFGCQCQAFFFWKTEFISSLSLLDKTCFPCLPSPTFYPRSLSKIPKKMNTNVDNWNLGIFVIFVVDLRYFLSKKLKLSLPKATGHPTLSILTLSNISIHAVCQNFNKNCRKTQSWTILGFCHFWCQLDIFSKTAIILLYKDY